MQEIQKQLQELQQQQQQHTDVSQNIQKQLQELQQQQQQQADMSQEIKKQLQEIKNHLQPLSLPPSLAATAASSAGAGWWWLAPHNNATSSLQQGARAHGRHLKTRQGARTAGLFVCLFLCLIVCLCVCYKCARQLPSCFSVCKDVQQIPWETLAEALVVCLLSPRASSTFALGDRVFFLIVNVYHFSCVFHLCVKG